MSRIVVSLAGAAPSGLNARNPADEQLEREADLVASGGPPNRRPALGHTGSGGHLSTVEARERGERDATPVPGEGRALDPATRASMESRLGYDLAAVRIHDDAAAMRSARSLGARAYTYGSSIAFDAGGYDPGSHRGRALLAHELAHVVQQRNRPPIIQRQPAQVAPAPAAKVDVAIVLSGDDQDMVEGASYAKTVLRVFDAEDAAAKLKALKVPIGRLFVVSHSNAAGQVQFTSSSGTVNWLPIRDLAKVLKGSATIDDVDFRGCKVGDAPAAMETFRSGIGAKSVSASNCWTFTQRATPLTLDGVDVTTPSQIPAARQREFDTYLLRNLANMRAANGTRVQNCLVGLNRGERAGEANLARIWQLYWANKGNLIASWASPEYNEEWQPGSICVKDMTADTKPCAIVETRAPAPQPVPTGKTGALARPGDGSEIARADADSDALVDEGRS